jgi:serine/threonine protein phosphatase PrpC
MIKKTLYENWGLLMNITVSHYSSQGMRENNEDAVLFTESKDKMLAVVADGLGGHQAGEVASQIAVKTIIEQVSSSLVTQKNVSDAIYAANNAIRMQQTELINMKTTIAVLCLDEKQVIVANVGDTRIYHFRDDSIAFQSVDHSVSQMAVFVGEISMDEIRTHKDRNKLVRALGSQDDVKIDTKCMDWKKGDAFLLCSDGFWENVLENEMLYDLRSSINANEWLAKMRNRVEARIKPDGDNHSAIAVFIN